MFASFFNVGFQRRHRGGTLLAAFSSASRLFFTEHDSGCFFSTHEKTESSLCKTCCFTYRKLRELFASFQKAAEGLQGSVLFSLPRVFQPVTEKKAFALLVSFHVQLLLSPGYHIGHTLWKFPAVHAAATSHFIAHQADIIIHDSRRKCKRLCGFSSLFSCRKFQGFLGYILCMLLLLWKVSSWTHGTAGRYDCRLPALPRLLKTLLSFFARSAAKRRKWIEAALRS